MFGFGGRKKFNGAVDIKLNNEYQIQTRGNEVFFNVLQYLELIDMAWNSKMSIDEAALYIACLFYKHRLLKIGLIDDSKDLLRRIISVKTFGIDNGLISPERWAKFRVVINESNLELGLPEIN